jgi:lincosamide nucleotidyltransferase A/C/D/E
MNLGIKIWINGGWGVDALLGHQTRHHKDLDIAIQQKDIAQLCDLLAKTGYKKIREHSIWNFVLADDQGHEIDVHSFVYDDNGNVVEGIAYPAYSLTGNGLIDGYSVSCIAPEYVVQFRSGYELKEKDFQDVAAICEKFGIPLPNRFKNGGQ